MCQKEMKQPLKQMPVISSTFYCQKVCGDEEFSIEEWDSIFRLCLKLGLSEREMNNILEGEPCKTQCEACACIVGEQRIKTQTLISGHS